MSTDFLDLSAAAMKAFATRDKRCLFLSPPPPPVTRTTPSCARTGARSPDCATLHHKPCKVKGTKWSTARKVHPGPSLHSCIGRLQALQQ